MPCKSLPHNRQPTHSYPEDNWTLVRFQRVAHGCWAGLCAPRQLAASRTDPAPLTAAAPLRGDLMGSFFSNFWTDFIGRFDGPLHFRLFVQPLMAIVFAVRDGSRDARERRSAYLWSLLTDPGERLYLVQTGWKGISKVFVLAFALDVV